MVTPKTAKTGCDHFQDIYEVRTDLTKFVNRLRQKVNDSTAWTEVPVKSTTGRDRYASSKVTPILKTRVLALLDAWTKKIDSRYLDVRRLRRIHQEHGKGKRPYVLAPGKRLRMDNVAAALRIVSRHAFKDHPGGAMAELSDVLTKNMRYFPDDSFYLFGEKLMHLKVQLYGTFDSTKISLNQYLSALLAWDDKHCFGIFDLINHEFAPGAGAKPFTVQAAEQWMTKHPDTVYSKYPIW